MRLSVFLVLAFAATGTRAATVELLSLPQLVERSALVVVGRCIAAEPVVRQDQPFTRYTFRVAQQLKGPAAEQVQLEIPGGSIDGYRVYVAGMPRFSPGAEAVVFLSPKDLHGYAWPVGLGQGHFRIERDATGKGRVYQETDGLRLVQAAARPVKDVLEAQPVRGQDLESFLRQVRSLTGTPEGDGEADMEAGGGYE